MPIRHGFRRFLTERGYYPGNEPPFGLSLARGIRPNFGRPQEIFCKTSSFSQQGEDLILDRIFTRRLGIDPRKHQGFYVDIGAYHPLSHSTTYLLYRFGWSGVCADISRKSCDLFKKIRPRDKTFHCAISSNDESSAFAEQLDIGLANEAKKAHPSERLDVGRNIDARTIDSILKEAACSRRVDYLNIDVEGAELAALSGFSFEKWKPRVISVEIHANDIQSALKHPVANYLLARNYICVACAAITYFFILRDEA